MSIMHSSFRHCTTPIPSLLRLFSASLSKENYNPFSPHQTISFSIPVRHFHQINSDDFTDNHKSTNSPIESPSAYSSADTEAVAIQTLLKVPIEEIERRLNESDLVLSEDLVLSVLKRHRSDWKPAYTFFNWVSRSKISIGFSPSTAIYNEMIDILGLMKQFDKVMQVFDEMSERNILINERTYGIVMGRLAAGHKVDEAIEFFHKIDNFGIQRDLIAFQTLLLCLCRYKHVETAEIFFRNYRNEFKDDIKTWNIILNGWCVLGSLSDAKRFWKDILASNCKPDKFTYGIFINALSKKGKISTAMKLLKTMWEKGARPDAAICNTVIDGLCFKKRIPEALEIFGIMNERNCPPNVATYNSLIKHFCKIRRMEEVDQLLNEMEERGESCSPNALTYIYLLKSAKKPEEVDEILERMQKNGCALQADIYNLILRLFVEWGDERRVKRIWNELEMSGIGPDQRSYTIIIHGLYDNGKIEDALKFFDEMVSKGMVPERRTKILVDDMKGKLRE